MGENECSRGGTNGVRAHERGWLEIEEEECAKSLERVARGRGGREQRRRGRSAGLRERKRAERARRVRTLAGKSSNENNAIILKCILGEHIYYYYYYYLIMSS